MPNTPNIRSNGRRDPNRHGLRRHMGNPYGNNGYRNGRNAIPSNGYVAPIGPGSRPGMRRKPGFYGGGGSSNIVQIATQIMNSGGWDAMDIHSCIACGGITSGGDGTLSDCHDCRDHINA